MTSTRDDALKRLMRALKRSPFSLQYDGVTLVFDPSAEDYPESGATWNRLRDEGIERCKSFQILLTRLALRAYRDRQINFRELYRVTEDCARLVLGFPRGYLLIAGTMEIAQTIEPCARRQKDKPTWEQRLAAQLVTVFVSSRADGERISCNRNTDRADLPSAIMSDVSELLLHFGVNSYSGRRRRPKTIENWFYKFGEPPNAR